MPLTQIALAAPAYNEAENIVPVLTEWSDHLKARFPDGAYEIVVCNDGSRDRTGAILDDLATSMHGLKPVHHPKNRGAAAALTTAIAATTKPWVLLIDSDGQFPITNLELLERAMDSAAKAYIGVRATKHDSAFARLGSWGSGALCNAVHGTHYRDFNSAFKLVDGPLLRSIPLEAKGLNYSTEITSRLLERGVTLKEVEIEHRARERGQSSMRALRGGLHRSLFVSYVAMRQALLKLDVIQQGGRPS